MEYIHGLLLYIWYSTTIYISTNTGASSYFFFIFLPESKCLKKYCCSFHYLYVLLHVGHTTSFFSSCETFIYCTITYFITVHMAWLVLIFLRLNWLFLSSSKSIFNDKTIRFNFRWLIVIYFTVFRSFGLHTKVFHTKGRHLCLGRIQYVQILL